MKKFDSYTLPLTDEQLTGFISFLTAAVRQYPYPVPAPDMTPLLRMRARLEKKEHLQNIKKLRKYLLKRHRQRQLRHPQTLPKIKFNPLQPLRKGSGPARQDNKFE